VLGGVGLTTAGLLISRLLTVASYLVLARLAAPEVFGLFAAGSIALGTGSIFVDSGMLAALIQRRDRLEEATQTAFVTTVAGGLALTLVALAVSPLVGLLFSSHQIGLVAAAMSGMLLLGAGTVVPNALLQRRFSFLRRVLIDPLGVVAFGVTGIAAFACGLGVWSLVLASYASELIQLVAVWKASGFRPNPRRASFGMWRELARYGRHILAGTFIDHLGLAINTFLLGRFVSTSALGEYRYATRFAILPQELAINAGSYVLLPAFARISHERERFEHAAQRSLRVLLAGVVPISLLLVPLGRPLVVLLLGERWRAAGVALMVLCLASAPGAAGSVAAETLKAAGRPDILPPLHLLQAVLSITLMLAFLPFGLTGIAAGIALGSILGNSCSVVRAVRVQRFDLRAVGSAIWPPYLAGAVMVAVLFPLERLWIHAEQHGVAAGLGLLVLEGLLGGAVYLACLLPASPPTAQEIGHGARQAATHVRSRAQRRRLERRRSTSHNRQATAEEPFAFAPDHRLDDGEEYAVFVCELRHEWPQLVPIPGAGEWPRCPVCNEPGFIRSLLVFRTRPLAPTILPILGVLLFVYSLAIDKLANIGVLVAAIALVLYRFVRPRRAR
jgi:PST family polysaccharide transporter